MSAALETASSLQDPSTSVLLQLFMLFFFLSASSVYYWTHWFLYTKAYCIVREVYTALFFIWKKKNVLMDFAGRLLWMHFHGVSNR